MSEYVMGRGGEGEEGEGGRCTELYVCMYVCMYVYMYVYIYIYIQWRIEDFSQGGAKFLE